MWILPGSIIPKSTPPHDRSFFGTEFDAKLKLFPNRNAENLKRILIFEKFNIVPCLTERPNADWVCVEDESGLRGFVYSKVGLSVKKNDFKDLFHKMDMSLGRNSIELSQKMELADSLTHLTKNGDFWGEDYLYVKAKAGEAVRNATMTWNVSRASTGDDWKEFLKRHESLLLFDFDSNRFYLDSNYFWKLVDASPSSKFVDHIGHLATQSEPPCSNKDDFLCALTKLRKGPMKFLYFFSNSRYSKEYFQISKKVLEEWAEDFESLPCYAPIDPSIAEEIERIDRYLDGTNGNWKSKLIPYFSIIKKECGG